MSRILTRDGHEGSGFTNVRVCTLKSCALLRVHLTSHVKRVFQKVKYISKEKSVAVKVKKKRKKFINRNHKIQKHKLTQVPQ